MPPTTQLPTLLSLSLVSRAISNPSLCSVLPPPPHGSSFTLFAASLASFSASASLASSSSSSSPPQTFTFSLLCASIDLAPPSFLPSDFVTGIDAITTAAAMGDGIAAPTPPNSTMSRVVVNGHEIQIRPWPHPNPVEVMKAHRIIERMQREQFGMKAPQPVIAVTPIFPLLLLSSPAAPLPISLFFSSLIRSDYPSSSPL